MSAQGLVIGVFVGAFVVTLWAQEPQQINRPLAVTQGNVTISRGVAISGAGLARDFRTSSAVSGLSQTYTAAQILSGLVQRAHTVSAGTDVLPTAADLAAAIPGVIAGTSFDFVVDTNASVTINGASTGVTYATPCSTALATSKAMHVMIMFTSTTAYRAVCVQ
jgi:hypothetical protein